MGRSGAISNPPPPGAALQFCQVWRWLVRAAPGLDLMMRYRLIITGLDRASHAISHDLDQIGQIVIAILERLQFKLYLRQRVVSAQQTVTVTDLPVQCE